MLRIIALWWAKLACHKSRLGKEAAKNDIRASLAQRDTAATLTAALEQLNGQADAIEANMKVPRGLRGRASSFHL
jgi:hypothetical protein